MSNPTFAAMVAARAATRQWVDILTDLSCAERDMRELEGKEVHFVTVDPGHIRVKITAAEMIAAIRRQQDEAMGKMMHEFPGSTREQVLEFVREWGKDQ